MSRLLRKFKGRETGPFSRYVVVDVVSSTNIDQESLVSIDKMLANSEKFTQTVADGEEDKKFLIAPRNSIIARDITQNQSETPSIKPWVVLYPFFSSHVALPVKPGEHVWGMAEDKESLFWLSRIHEPEYIEDSNYTHSDRISSPTTQNVLEYGLSKEKIEDIVPGLPNGRIPANMLSDRLPDDPKISAMEGVQKDSFTLSLLKEYEDIITNTMQKTALVFEPVPRLSKRPGDLVIQGSNNATILLGTERGYGLTNRPVESANSVLPENDQASRTGLAEGMGAIDIVVGRGRIHDGSESNVDLKPVNTQPRVVKNTRDNFETNKNVGLNEAEAPNGSAIVDCAEGDPDMIHDAARVYMSMKTNPDEVFNLAYPDLNSGTQVEPTADAASIVFKSDQVRIIARKDDENQINGSIRIIKEGEGDVDRATIVMQPDGTIMIDGPKIVIGSGIEGDNGEGSQVFIGRDATESVVLGNELKTMLTTFLVAIGTPAAASYIGNMGGQLATPIPAADIV